MVEIEADEPERKNRATSLLESVNASANTSRNNWLFFMALLAYLFVTVSGVTHKDLLMDAPVKLPILNVDIALSRFFKAAPVGLLIIYFGILFQHDTLARKARALKEQFELEEAPEWGGLVTRPNKHQEHPLRMQLSTYFFVQAIAGPKPGPIRRGLLTSMLVLTLAILPMIVLAWFQISYLPFHSEETTLLHQGYMSIGIALAWGLSRSYWATKPSTWARFVAVGASIAALLFTWGVATVPDSVADKFMASIDGVDVPLGLTDLQRNFRYERRAFRLTAHLFEGGVNHASGETSSPFSRNLVVTDAVLDKDAHRGKLTVTDNGLLKETVESDNSIGLSLRERNLKYATLDRSVLTRVDFTGANLFASSMIGSDLRRARFGCAASGKIATTSTNRKSETERQKLEACLPLERASTRYRSDQVCTIFAASDMSNVNLRGANLTRLDLRNVNFEWSDLREVYFGNANLCGATLGTFPMITKMHGSDLSGANLFGADLDGAEVQGVDFSSADLTLTVLDGANFDLADLSNATIIMAQAKHVSLLGARLPGTSLNGTSLFGAKVSSEYDPPNGPALYLSELTGLQVLATGSKFFENLKKLAGPAITHELNTVTDYLQTRFQRRISEFEESFSPVGNGSLSSSSSRPNSISVWQALVEMQSRDTEHATRRKAAFLDMACREARSAYIMVRQLRYSFLSDDSYSENKAAYTAPISDHEAKYHKDIERIPNWGRLNSAKEPTSEPSVEAAKPRSDSRPNPLELSERLNRGDCPSSQLMHEMIAKKEMPDIFKQLEKHVRQYRANEDEKKIKGK